MALHTLTFMSLLCFMVGTVLSEFSAEDCWSLGLNKANLLCSSCEQLKSFHLGILKEHCLQCCQRDEDTLTVKRYAQARLEPRRIIGGIKPFQVKAFVKSDRPSKFPNLQIKYVRGLDPIIKLMDKDGNIQDVLAIEKWDTDTVEEFLKTHLTSPDEEKEDYLRTNEI
uniref:Selenoprotein F n=1 Tax=Timema cristinae TaxID=61476 RepID=A0A7R9DDY5_TIMCR|nr:unnamed protein product [Timema cristinae]